MYNVSPKFYEKYKILVFDRDDLGRGHFILDGKIL